MKDGGKVIERNILRNMVLHVLQNILKFILFCFHGNAGVKIYAEKNGHLPTAHGIARWRNAV